MQQHVCINMFLSLYLILFLIKLLFPKFNFPQNAKLITFSYFKNMQNLGCYTVEPVSAAVTGTRPAESRTVQKWQRSPEPDEPDPASSAQV